MGRNGLQPVRIVFLALVTVVIIFTMAIRPSPAATTTPQYGGVLKIIAPFGPTVLGDPTKIRPGLILGQLYAALESLISADKNGQAAPWLATGWEWSPSGKSVTLTLRKGVKFHDGTDFNAEAVKWNLERQKAARRLRLVRSVEVVDEYTVRLNLLRFNNTFLTSLALPDGMMVSPTAIKKNGAEWAFTHIAATGPFKLSGFKRGVSMKFTRFDDYWDKGKPYLDGVEFLYVADPVTALVSFEAGEAHMMAMLQPNDAFTLKKKGFMINTFQIGGGANLAPDSANPDSPFADKRVREALEYAVDRLEVAQVLGYGFWEPHISQVVPAGSWAYSPDYKGRQYNPDKAKRLLSEAGYPNGFKTRIIVMPQMANAFTAVQGYLGKVGIDAKLELADRGRLESYALVSGWKNGLLWGGAGSTNYTDLLTRSFSERSPFFPSMQRPKGLQAAIEKAIGARDFKSQAALTRKALMLIAEDAMLLTLWGDSARTVKVKEVHDTGMATFHHLLWTPANAWLSK
jgi:ABC-type transport system substrate-binding protein